MHTSTSAALRNIEALTHFAAAFGVDVPETVKAARAEAVGLDREHRLRPPFDMKSAAAAAVGGDVDKAVKALAKAATTDAAERAAMLALVEATAAQASGIAQAATYEVIEAAMNGPVLRRAADELSALAGEGHLPIVIGEDDPDAAIVHARARKAEKVAEAFAARAAALPGYGGQIEYPVLLLVSPEMALERGATWSSVRASARGIAGSTDLGAWQMRPMSALPEFRPLHPEAPASLLLLRKGSRVEAADSLDEVEKRHALVDVPPAPASTNTVSAEWL